MKRLTPSSDRPQSPRQGQDVYAFDLWFKTANIDAEFEKKLLNPNKLMDKAYGCFIDANVLMRCKENPAYRTNIQGSTFNFVDGRLVALFVSWFTGYKVEAYPGPRFFSKFSASPKRHLVVGGSHPGFLDLSRLVKERNPESGPFEFLEIPFCDIEHFDFESIARNINAIQPDIIWVSLGAPKQEAFVARIFPLVNRGYFFAVGAAFGFFTGKLITTKRFGRVPIVWILRLIKEPIKQLERCVFILARIVPFVIQAWREKP